MNNTVTIPAMLLVCACTKPRPLPEATVSGCEGIAASDYEREASALFTPVDSERAVFHGVIRSNTPGRFQDLLEQVPGLTTLVLAYGPGSADDDAMLELAYAVREAGLSTCVPASGMVASGATDLFIAGTNRTVGVDGLVGVHSWSDGTQDGVDYPADSPEHQPYIDYYEEMGLADPSGFYFFTLNAAPAADVHWMSTDELQSWGVVTP